MRAIHNLVGELMRRITDVSNMSKIRYESNSQLAAYETLKFSLDHLSS